MSSNVSRERAGGIPTSVARDLWKYPSIVRSAGYKDGPTYRGDIDGLRGLAVSLVVLFHAWSWLVPGGFVGVDVFFVISGYLITGIIRPRLRQNRFSYLEFFGRRIRRIGPALVLVLLASLAMGSLVLPYPNFQALGLQATAASGFSANILFWLNAGYFDAVAESKPLLHLWSLGIEEQFYLVWPALMAVAVTLGARSRVMVLSIISLSFAANVALIGAYPDATFYLLPGRLWELGLGGMLACRHEARDGAGDGELANNLKAWLGVLLIAVSAALLNWFSRFPGWWAVLPTVGAMLVIDAGPDAWLNRHVLASPPLRGAGLISYPVYLWHWPLLVFADFAGYTEHVGKVGVVAVTVLLSYLTYRFVEVPIRFGRRAGRQSESVVVSTILAGMVLAGVLGQFAPILQRNARALPYWAVADYRAEAFTAYRQDSCFLGFTRSAIQFAADCDGGKESVPPRSRKLVMLWGDSHAAHLWQGLAARQRSANRDFLLAQYTASVCPPIFGITVETRQNCRGVVDAVEGTIGRLRPDVVIMSADWSLYANGFLDPTRITETVRRLYAMGVPHVIVIGPVPEWAMPLPQALLRDFGISSDPVPEYRTNAPPFRVEATISAAVTAAGARYVSAIDALCDDHRGCLATVTTANGPEPTAWDKAHFTTAGSIAFINKIWDRQIVPDLYRTVSPPTSTGNETMAR